MATIWDVTDRDNDTFAQSTFDELRLNFDNVKSQKARISNRTPVSVVAGVATSREVCKLKYMNGAAPVAYKIPFYLELNLYDRIYLVMLIYYMMAFDIALPCIPIANMTSA